MALLTKEEKTFHWNQQTVFRFQVKKLHAAYKLWNDFDKLRGMNGKLKREVTTKFQKKSGILYLLRHNKVSCVEDVPC